MISIDFYWLVAVYLGIFIGLFFIFEFKKKLPHKDFDIDPRFIWNCSICTYTYIDTRNEVFSICPRCGCYNSR